MPRHISVLLGQALIQHRGFHWRMEHLCQRAESTLLCTSLPTDARWEHKKNPNILQLCTYFQNDSLPLVGTFNSECVMLLSLLLFLQPPPSPRSIHLARCDICSMCFRFYGSCCSQGLVDPTEEEKARGGQVWVPGYLFSVSEPGSIGHAPGVARFHGRQWSRARSICFLLRWVWWSFTPYFLLSCWGLQFGSKKPSDSAFQMVRMQMPDPKIL